MADGKPDTADAAHQVLVLAFDLAESEISQLPSQLAKALESPPVQQAINKTLIDFAKTKSTAGGGGLTSADGQKLLEALGTSVKDAAGNEILEQIKKTPEYQRLKSSLEAFKSAAGSSTLGVWVDKNKNILYVVGAALIIGSASVLYVTKTGGTVLNTTLDPLKGKEFEVLQIGKLKIKAGLWDFEPTAQILGARIAGTQEWEKVTLDFKLGVLAQGTQVQQVQGSVMVKSGGVNLSLTGDGKPQTQQIDLGLKLGYDGVIGNGKFNIGVGAMYKDNAVSGTLGASYQTKGAIIGLQGNVGPDKGGGVQYGGLLTLTIPL